MCLRERPPLVRCATHVVIDLGRDDMLLAFQAKIFEHTPEDFFADAQRISVGRVPERDAEIDRVLEDRLAFVFIEEPGARILAAISHHAETQTRHFKAGFAERNMIHDRLTQ